jgi:hypothetical protein
MAHQDNQMTDTAILSNINHMAFKSITGMFFPAWHLHIDVPLFCC